MAKFYLSPSRIARYYYLECDRFLRYMAVPRERRREEGIPKMESDYSPVARAVLEGGHDWEQVVVEQHLSGEIIAASGEDEQPLHERKLGYAETVDALRSLVPGQSIYQPTLQVPSTFYQRFELDPELVSLTECYPDLIMCVDGPTGPELRVVDVKASNWMKLSHRIQVGIYTLILSEVLQDEGVETPISRTGGVWLYGEPQPEWFNLAHIIPPIETFLVDDLPRILTGTKDEAFWHINFRCEWCEYFTHCRSQAEQSNDVSLVPFLSNFAKRHLVEVGDVNTLDDLGVRLNRSDVADLAAGSASLEGRVRSCVSGHARRRTGQSGPHPAIGAAHWRDVLVRLQRVFGKDLYGEATDLRVRVAETGAEDSLIELRRNLVRDLTEVFSVVDDHNRSTDDWWAQKSVQTYVYDTYERGLLTTVLMQAVLDPKVAEDALALIFFFQRPEIVEAESHPDTEVFFPVIALTEVIRSVFALPVPISYQLAPVSLSLAPSQYAWEYRESDFFSFRLSNRMKSNAIFEVWHRDRRDLIPNITTELTSRVRAANSIINGIRERLDGTGSLFAWPPKFRFPQGSDFTHPLLSRLGFIARYESVLGYLDIRTRRGAPLEERIASESTLRLTYLGDDRYQLDPDQLEADIGISGWSNWILTGDHEAGRRARLSYADFFYRQASWAPKNLDLALAAVLDRESEGVLKLRLTPSQAFTAPVVGEIYFLEPRYTDWTTEPLLRELGGIDGETAPWFVDLLSDPVTALRTLNDPELAAHALGLAKQHGMTASQTAAFADTLTKNLALVWGPPGTGKTHFLALSVLFLVEASRRLGRSFRVLITAMTNAAIDNCLNKLVELQETHQVVKEDFLIGKLVGEPLSSVSSIDPKNVQRDLADESLVVLGGTVWQARKTSPDNYAYDLVVIDEGSQLRVADSAIAIRRVGPGGRLLVAGDDKQLAPIVQAEYPIAEEGLPLHRSILEALRAGDEDGTLTRALVENWRMNSPLCEYPRLSIYPAEYQPATSEVAARRLVLGDSDHGLAELLDPQWPVTMCVLEGVKATSRNPVEARLAARVVAALRELLPVSDDEEFASESVFVVSPHHAQIRLVRRALEEIREWDPLPLIGTVDKMQGQERDAVVVSYGVSDVETALNERQFIYSLNRLNVAITRARAKTILFLPRPLLEPPIQVLDLDDVAEGVAYMQGLMHWCVDQTEPLHRNIEGNEITIYRG